MRSKLDPHQNSPSACQLCGRPASVLTRHHLIPRMRHRHKRTQRRFSRADMRGNLLWLCAACHKQVHAVLSEKELADRYTTREALLAHEPIARFVDWIRAKPADYIPRTYAMKRQSR